MSVRSQSKVFCRPKLEPLTTPALRFGKTNLMIKDQIFGLSDVSSMS
jgi:hypothetical protein